MSNKTALSLLIFLFLICLVSANGICAEAIQDAAESGTDDAVVETGADGAAAETRADGTAAESDAAGVTTETETADVTTEAASDTITTLPSGTQGGTLPPEITPDALTPLAEGIKGKLSLDLRNIDIIDALKFLAMKTGISIVATKNVTGKITLIVESVPIQDVFDIMLRSNDLAYAIHGSIYNVMTENEYKEIFGKKFSDIRQVKTLRLRYAIPEQAFALVDTLKSDIGRVLVEPDSGTVMILDTPEKVAEIEKALGKLEEKNIVRVFTLQYAHAKDVEEHLKTQLDAKKVGTIKADERSNQVVIQALPDRMRDIEKLIAALDEKTKEVLIDTKIVKIKLSDDLDQKIEWEGLVKVGTELGMTYFGSTPFAAVQAAADAWRSRSDVLEDVGGKVGSYPFSGTTSNYSGATKVVASENMNFGVIDRQRDFDVFIKYLQTLGNTQILSNPKLAVVNNQEAKIHIGERQAYVTTTTTTTTGGTSTAAEEVTFIDVGIQLSVTPTINDEGYITMKIKPEISSVVDHLLTPSKNLIPIIDTSTAETTVMVKDGATIIIGGLRKEAKVSNEEKFPFLGDMPFIGALFKSTSKSVERTELLIMITPHIVTGDVLTTGDERDMRKEGKDYSDYSTLADGMDSAAPSEKPIEEKIRPYREYIKEEEEK